MASKNKNLFKWFVRLNFNVQVISLIAISILAIVIMRFGYYHLTHKEGQAFYYFYQTSIRGYLFSGFISVGSLLMSLHTFVIANFKEKLFTTRAYIEKFANSRQISDITKVNEKDLLKPLDKLSSFINISIWLSILTAVAQFSIGLADYGALSTFCIWIAMLTICFLLNCLILIRENIRNMLQQDD